MYRLCTILGIPVIVHWTFGLLILYFTLVQGLEGLLALLIVFGSVLLHEFGHALMARRFGIETQGIILLPIGGLACLKRFPKKPNEEFIITIAGPAVNVVLIMIGVLIQCEFLWIINIVLTVFNLLPLFPMDGGRLLRATLACIMNHRTATMVSARIGQGLAICIGIFALCYHLWLPMLVLTAAFLMAEREIRTYDLAFGESAEN